MQTALAHFDRRLAPVVERARLAVLGRGGGAQTHRGRCRPGAGERDAGAAAAQIDHLPADLAPAGVAALLQQ